MLKNKIKKRERTAKEWWVQRENTADLPCPLMDYTTPLSNPEICIEKPHSPQSEKHRYTILWKRKSHYSLLKDKSLLCNPAACFGKDISTNQAGDYSLLSEAWIIFRNSLDPYVWFSSHNVLLPRNLFQLWMSNTYQTAASSQKNTPQPACSSAVYALFSG